MAIISNPALFKACFDGDAACVSLAGCCPRAARRTT
jgi:hypothetical protein